MDGGIIMENGNKRTLEVRWHGRGGQGAKSASAILAEVLFEEGKAPGIPEYGAERQGAPMRAYNRVSDTPIRRRCSVENPNIVVIVDPTMVAVQTMKAVCPMRCMLSTHRRTPVAAQHDEPFSRCQSPCCGRNEDHS